MTSEKTPLEEGYKANLKYDFPAGIVVFLVALPLCLGIALASEAPLFSGIITGSLAGLVVSWLSGSHLSVSGPAAGLAVIVSGAIASCGGFESFLAAVVLSGALQVLLGFVGAGAVANIFPISVIKGMLAAIGIIIFLKQIPHALGRDTDYEGDLAFFQFLDGENTFTEIAKAVASYSPGAVTISVTCLAVLILWTKWNKPKWLSPVPGPLVAVVLGIVINESYPLFAPNWVLLREDGHLVDLPVASSFLEFTGQFQLPNWEAFLKPVVWKSSIVIALIGSIETLLCLEATDKLDPFHRISDANRELKAQGVGNLLAGFIGGIPMTSVIVRSSSNVYSGARTRISAFIHGVLLLFTVAFIPGLLNKTPLAALAAVLLMVGYKLAQPSLIKKIYSQGWSQFLPFSITILAIVFTDLLTGVIIGLIVGLINVILTNYQSALSLVQENNGYLIRLKKDVSFLNKIELKNCLSKIPSGSKVTIDGSQAEFIDRDFLEVIEDFEATANYRNITVDTNNLESRSISLVSAKKSGSPRS